MFEWLCLKKIEPVSQVSFDGFLWYIEFDILYSMLWYDSDICGQECGMKF